jgi:Fibronectin type III domain
MMSAPDMQGFSTASSAPETSVQIAGLIPGTDYEFRVFAVNSFGQSPASDSCAWSSPTLLQCGRACTASLACRPHTAVTQLSMASLQAAGHMHHDKAVPAVECLIWYGAVVAVTDAAPPLAPPPPQLEGRAAGDALRLSWQVAALCHCLTGSATEEKPLVVCRSLFSTQARRTHRQICTSCFGSISAFLHLIDSVVTRRAGPSHTGLPRYRFQPAAVLGRGVPGSSGGRPADIASC